MRQCLNERESLVDEKASQDSIWQYSSEFLPLFMSTCYCLLAETTVGPEGTQIACSREYSLLYLT